MNSKYFMIRKWVINYIKKAQCPVTQSEIACDAGSYDDAFLAGRSIQDLIHQGKISLNSGWLEFIQISEQKVSE